MCACVTSKVSGVKHSRINPAPYLIATSQHTSSVGACSSIATHTQRERERERGGGGGGGREREREGERERERAPPGGATNWTVAVEVGEQQPLVCHPLYVGCVGGWVAIGRQVSPSQLHRKDTDTNWKSSNTANSY